MKVLFLDIDGVLNSELWYTHAHYCIMHNKKNEIFSNETSNENDSYVDYNIAYVGLTSHDADMAIEILNRI